MGNIAKIIDQVLVIDGNIKLVPYCDKFKNQFDELILWQVERSSQTATTRYADLSWIAAGEKRAITFNDAPPQLSYELKSLTLGMITHGAGQGMEPCKWSRVHSVILQSKRFGLWLNKQNVDSLLALNSLPLLVLRNLIIKFLKEKNVSEHIHVAQGLSTAVYWWAKYGILDSLEKISVFTELLEPHIAKKSTQRQKHSVVPTQVMKKVLAECEEHLNLALSHFEKWFSIQKKLNERIPNLGAGHFNINTFIDALDGTEQCELNELHPYFLKLRSYVFTLVLAYSGMRHNEVMDLDDNAAFQRNGKYYVKGYLSKTTDEQQELEWVVSKSAYDGVKLLSNMNAIYRERAKLLDNFYGNKLPAHRAKNMRFGATTSKLFQVTHYKQSVFFTNQSKLTKNGFNNINNLFSISLTQNDIEQLEKLDCNIESVSSNHKGFRKPYKVGMTFNFTSHQFRHTFAWFIVANRLGDLDDIKYQFKHLENSMSLVYSHRGYDSMAELLKLAESFEEYLTTQAMDDMVDAAKNGQLAGRGGQKFIERLQSILGDDFENGSSPHFKNMQELVTYAAKHSQNFRGLSHGYCTKGNACKVRNAADPSHCINCDSYIATPKHLPHWKVIKQRCEKQLTAFEDFPDEIKPRFESFKGALIDNLCAANTIIQQLEISVRKA